MRVKNGQAAVPATGTPGAAGLADIAPVAFRNPRHPGLGLEVMSFAELAERLPADHREQVSRPDFHQLLLVTAGRLVHQVDFAPLDCPAGELLHLRPGQLQRHGDWRGASGLLLLFRPDFLPPEPLLDLWRCPSRPARLQPAPAAFARIRAAAELLAATYAACDAGALATRLLQHQLAALLMQVEAAEAARVAALPAPPADAALRVFRRFLQELEGHHARTRRVEDYAERIGCSSKTLARACLQLAGTAPKALIEQRVALEARRLLVHTRLPVQGIALELGFSEPTNFIKFFRRACGQAPAAFRAAQLDAAASIG